MIGVPGHPVSDWFFLKSTPGVDKTHSRWLIDGTLPHFSARRGPEKVVVAVRAFLLTAVDFILRDGSAYHDATPGRATAAGRGGGIHIHIG